MEIINENSPPCHINSFMSSNITTSSSIKQSQPSLPEIFNSFPKKTRENIYKGNEDCLSNLLNFVYFNNDNFLYQLWLIFTPKISKYLSYNKSTYTSLPKNKQQKLKTLKYITRFGIPDHLRGFIWQKFVGYNHAQVKGKYDTYMQSFISLRNNPDDDFETTNNDIIKDLDRTAHSTFFNEKGGIGQISLYNVLSIFSRQNSIGYVQGMSFFAASFLSYMDEEQSYWMMYYLTEDYNMKGYYQKGFPELKCSYYKLLSLMKKYLPAVYNVLRNAKVCPDYYACQWFLTLFYLNVKQNVFVRILDVFLYEKNFKIVYRIALALLKLNESKILSNPKFDTLMGVVQNLGNNVDLGCLFEEAFSIKITQTMLNEIGMQYNNLMKLNQSDEIIEQIEN